MTVNKDPVDRFTLAHVLAGYAARRVGLTQPQTLMLAIAWEIIEPKLKENNPQVFPNPSKDTTENKVVDVLATMLGWALG